MKRLCRCCIAVYLATVVPLISALPLGAAEPEQLAEQLLVAEQQQAAIPLLSVSEPELDLAKAYQVQQAYVAHRLESDTLAGFKAGLTAKPGQQRFGLSEPVAGVLFASGRLANNARVARSDFGQLMIETELGLLLAKPLRHPLEDMAALKSAVAAVVPVIELPDLGFADLKQLSGVDIVAANVSARGFIVGEPLAVDSEELNQLSVSLMMNDQAINHGHATDAMGDQWQAAWWLANTLLAQYGELPAGSLLLTGALGKMLPAKPGEYLASYALGQDDLGQVSFQISE